MPRIEPYPPADPEAEKATLGSILIDPDARALATEILKPEDFFREDNRCIYQAIVDLGDTPADVVTVSALLEQRGQLGGLAFGMLVDLANTTPTSVNAEHYARIVAERARRRRWIAGAGLIAGAAYHDDGRDPADIARELLLQDRRPGGWHWRTLQAAYAPRPPRRYLAGGLLPLPSLAALFGPPGSLKTMLLMDLAVCISAGLPWLEPLPGEAGSGRSGPAAPVLWLDCDNGLDRVERRFAALGRGHSAPATALLHYVSFPIPPFAAQEPAAVQTVVDAALGWCARLIVFDNLGTISGGADENSSDMIAVMSGLRRIAEDSGAAVVVIHHRNKTGGARRPGDALRGHTSIEAALDLALQVEREEGADTITIHTTKARDAGVEPFSALWTLDRDAAGELASARFFGLGRPESQALSKPDQAALCIMTELRNSMSQTDIIKMVSDQAGIGRNTTLATLDKLVGQGKLTARAGDSARTRIYERSQPPA
jgi:AAA domain/DnaB-like helicase N terminal domain